MRQPEVDVNDHRVFVDLNVVGHRLGQADHELRWIDQDTVGSVQARPVEAGAEATLALGRVVHLVFLVHCVKRRRKAGEGLFSLLRGGRVDLAFAAPVAIDAFAMNDLIEPVDARPVQGDPPLGIGGVVVEALRSDVVSVVNDEPRTATGSIVAEPIGFEKHDRLVWVEFGQPTSRSEPAIAGADDHMVGFDVTGQ